MCWDFHCNIITIGISGLILYLSESLHSQIVIFFVRQKKSAGNPRFGIVRTFSSHAGTLETTRAATNSKKKKADLKFNQWLAGVIDGDGSFLLSKIGYASLEITMGLEDLKLLRYIQDKLGGSVKKRSGAKAYRYRLHDKESIYDILCRVNGEIRNSVRIVQFHRLCNHFNIPVIEPAELTKENY